MNKIYTIPLRAPVGLRRFAPLFLLCLLYSFVSPGQACYQPISGSGVVVGTASGVSVCINQACLGAANYNNLQNVIDSDINTFADANTILNALNQQSILVRKTNGSFPAGYVAGFVLSRAGLAQLSLLNDLTIATYRNGNPTGDSRQVGALVSGTLLSGEQKFYATFITTQEFDEVRLTVNALSAQVLTNLKVYAALAFPQNCSVENNGVCDDFIQGLNTDVIYDGSLTCVACSLTDGERLNNGDKNDYALLTLPAGVLTSVSVGVIDRANTYPAGTRAGFVLAPNTNTLLAANILNTLSVDTYLYGQLQESQTFGAGGSLLNLTALSGSGNTIKQRLSFTTTKAYNEVRLRVNQPVGVNVGTLRLYGAFEEPTTCTDCQQPLTAAGAGKYNGVLQANEGCVLGVCATVWTGIFGLGVGQSLANEGNVVDADLNNFATYDPGAVGVGSGARVTVKNDGTLFPVGTFAGFVISRESSLIDVGLLNNVVIRAYNNSTLVGSATASSLLAASVVGGGSNRNIVGFYPTAPFNRIQIEIGSLVSVLEGTYRIYYAFVIEDTDNDGTADCNDNCPTGNNNLDYDGDGLADACDPDDDNDGIPDTVEVGPDSGNPRNSDGDGPPDFQDLDSDNDGIPDSVERGPDGNNPRDTDGDGSPDYRDTDSDNDGIPDSIERGPDGNNPRDTDSDGLPDYRDPDSDGDGIPDSVERGPDGNNPRDSDGDGRQDYLDLDSDNDGITDATEKGPDGSNPTNSDNDPLPDYRDLDADNDGINDVVEGGGTDADGNGIADGPVGDNGIPSSAGNGLNPPNTDGDAKPDYQDVDSDNDGVRDLYESGIPNPSSLDANNDGVVDDVTDPDNDGIPLPVDGLPATYGDANNPTLPDTDGDTTPDYRDGAPDLTPTIRIDNLSFVEGASRDFVVNIFEIRGVPTSAPVTFRINKLTAFTITYPTSSGTSNVQGGTANQNGDWEFSDSGAFIVVTSKAGVVIPANGRAVIGFNISRNASIAPNTTQNITATIVGGTGGGETPQTNNRVNTSVSTL